MIIFGTRSYSSTKGQGDFFCPQCTEERAFRKKRGRRFFHIYFIPLIPVSEAQEYIKCTGCKADFQLAVLDHNPGATIAGIKQAFETAIRNTIVAMIAADGDIDPQEVDKTLEIVAQTTKVPLGHDEIVGLAADALDGQIPIESAMQELAPLINEHAKEMLIRIALEIAAADGEIVESEIDLVGRIANSLGMSPAHLQGIVATAASERTQDPQPSGA